MKRIFLLVFLAASVSLGNINNPTSSSLVVGTDVEAWDTDLDVWAGITPSTKANLASPIFTGLLTTPSIKGTAGSYTVTMNGANTASVKTTTGSDISGVITLTMSSTGNTLSSICTISGFNWTSAPNTIIIYGQNTNASAAQFSTKVITVTSITTTSFDLVGGSAGLTSGTSYVYNYLAIQ